MKHFNNIADLNELRKAYRELSFINHPDVSGFDSTLIMQEINAEYKELGDLLAASGKFADSEIEFNSLYKEKIEALIKIKNISIELIGNWIWVTGETKAIKETLKGMKFRFAPLKKAWYFKNYSYVKKTTENVSFEEMRALYGCKKFSTQSDNNEKSILLNS